MKCNEQLILNGFSPCPSCFIFFNESPLKMMKSAFYINIYIFFYLKSCFRFQDV